MNNTIEALPRIIHYLKEHGYEIVTVPELLGVPAYAGNTQGFSKQPIAGFDFSESLDGKIEVRWLFTHKRPSSCTEEKGRESGYIQFGDKVRRK